MFFRFAHVWSRNASGKSVTATHHVTGMGCRSVGAEPFLGRSSKIVHSQLKCQQSAGGTLVVGSEIYVLRCVGKKVRRAESSLGVAMCWKAGPQRVANMRVSGTEHANKLALRSDIGVLLLLLLLLLLLTMMPRHWHVVSCSGQCTVIVFDVTWLDLISFDDLNCWITHARTHARTHTHTHTYIL